MFSSFRGTSSSFLTACVINILDAARLMTSAMIEPWKRTVGRIRIGMTDLDALVVVRIFLVAWTTTWHEISRDPIFENFNSRFFLRSAKITSHKNKSPRKKVRGN